MSGPAGDEVRFGFAFDRRFRLPLALLGVTPRTTYVTVTPDRVVARFGPWVCETPIANVIETCITEGYRWYTAIGPRGSFADRGLTFGTNRDRGLCLRLREPVPGLDPFGRIHHPGLTVTVVDPEGLAAAIAARRAP